MTGLSNKLAAVTLAAASAFAGGAEAQQSSNGVQTYDVPQQQTLSPYDACRQVAASGSLQDFPAQGIALGRNASVGCKATLGVDAASGAKVYSIQQTFDFRARGAEQQYVQNITRAQQMETNAQQRAATAARRDEIQNNPLTNARRQANDAAQTLQSLRNFGNAFGR